MAADCRYEMPRALGSACRGRDAKGGGRGAPLESRIDESRHAKKDASQRAIWRLCPPLLCPDFDCGEQRVSERRRSGGQLPESSARSRTSAV